MAIRKVPFAIIFLQPVHVYLIIQSIVAPIRTILPSNRLLGTSCFFDACAPIVSTDPIAGILVASTDPIACFLLALVVNTRAVAGFKYLDRYPKHPRWL